MKDPYMKKRWRVNPRWRTKADIAGKRSKKIQANQKRRSA